MSERKNKGKKKAEAPREPGPMDTAVMVCKICGHPEFEAVYQVVWIAEDHPANQTGQPFFQSSLFKYVCKKCGGEDAVLPPGFEALRAAMKQAQNPMRIVEKQSHHEGHEGHEEEQRQNGDAA
jgi:hypothetical protein